MKLLLTAVLATVLVAPCMAASENQSEDKTQGDVQKPGVTEPSVPDTLKRGADERIRTEGRASQGSAVEEKAPGAAMERRNEEKKEDKK
jgi:hypothetical protein